MPLQRGLVGGLDLIAEVTAPSNVQILDITGLDINTHKFYLIVLKIKNALPSGLDILMFINGDYTSTNYYVQWLEANSATVSAGRVNSATVMVVSANIYGDAVIKMVRGTTGFPSAFVQERESAASVVRMIQRVWAKTAIVTNITSIRIYAIAGAYIEAGSSVAVYGYRAP